MLGCIGVQLNRFTVQKETVFMNRRTRLEAFHDELNLMNFLYTQRRLETLALSNIYVSTDVFANFGNGFQFKLKKLSLHECFEEFIEDVTLKDFQFTQRDSVEILELGITFSNLIYEFILNEFKNVKTLSFNFPDFPTDLSFYKSIRINKNVTKLVIFGKNDDTAKYCTILSLFPNVTDISFALEVRFEVENNYNSNNTDNIDQWFSTNFCIYVLRNAY